MSSRIWRQPSERTTCSRPSGPTAAASHGARCSRRRLSGSAGLAGTAATLIVPGSRSACQMIRAEGAARSGSSAKVQPPLERIFSRRAERAPRRGARADVPGDIAGIAAQPFPHQSGAIDPAQPQIGCCRAPVRRVILLGRLVHDPVPAGPGRSSPGTTIMEVSARSLPVVHFDGAVPPLLCAKRM